MALTTHSSFSHLLAGTSLPVGAMGGRKICNLHHLLTMKGHELNSKSLGTKTIAFSVNEIAFAIISAYALCYEKTCFGEHAKTVLAIFAERDLRCGFKIKGSTVAKLIEEAELDTSDLDTSLDFNKIPLPKGLIGESPEEIQAFLSTGAGRSFLIGFYKSVACEATKSLLHLENQKIFFQNAERVKASLAQLPLRSEADIEGLKDKFFNNLFLFEGNSTFLITFSTIDFAIKVPFFNLTSYVHKADSLEIDVPCDIPSGLFALTGATLNTPFTLSEAFQYLSLKKIAIHDPTAVKFNGFERVIYAMTQGWTVIDAEHALVLLQDLKIRTYTTQRTNIPCERLYALMDKKSQQGASETFLLRLFLNTYLSAYFFSKKDPDHFYLERQGIGVEVCDLLHQGFLRPEYRKYFPKIVQEHFKKFGELNELAFLEVLKLQLESKKPIVTTHFGQIVSILGSGDKKQGCLLAPYLGIGEAFAKLDICITNLDQDLVVEYLAPSLSMYDGLEISLKEKIKLRLFSYLCNLHEIPSAINTELLENLDDIMQILEKNPSLISRTELNNELSILFLNNEAFFAALNPNFGFLKVLLLQSSNAPIIPLFYFALKNQSSSACKAHLQTAYTRIDEPVIFESLLVFLLNTENTEFSELIGFQLIQESCTILDTSISSKFLAHPRIKKMLSDDAIIELMEDAFIQKLMMGNIELFLIGDLKECGFKIFEKKPVLFDRIFTALPKKDAAIFFKTCLKASKQELLSSFISSPLACELMLKIQKEEAGLLKTKAFKSALEALSSETFNAYIHHFLSTEPLHGLNLVTSLMGQEELAPLFCQNLESLTEFCRVSDLRTQLAEPLLKLINTLALTERNAICALKVSSCLELSKKPNTLLFKGCFDRFGAILIALRETTSDAQVQALIKQALTISPGLLPSGTHFAGRWRIECEALAIEFKTLEECIVDFAKKPSEALVLCMVKKLKERTVKIEEPVLNKLKELFGTNPEYNFELLKHIMIYQADAIKEKFTKDLFPKITDEAYKLPIFNLYLNRSESYKHISTVLQAVKIDSLDSEEAIALLARIFALVNVETKIAVFNKFKEVSRLKSEKLDVLFEFAKQIDPPSIKKNSILEFFITNFPKLNEANQVELLVSPMYFYVNQRGEDCVLPLIEKAKVCPKALDAIISVINKRTQEGFLIKSDVLIEMTSPLFEHLHTHYTTFEHTESIHRFFEKFVQMRKEREGWYALSLMDRFLSHFDQVPLYELLQEMVSYNPVIVPVSMLLVFLEKRKHMPSFTKPEGEKYIKIFKHLLGKAETQDLLDLFHVYNHLKCFNDLQKKELLCLIIQKACEEKRFEFLMKLFGTKKALGYRSDLEPSVDITLFKSASKASRKLISDTLQTNLSKASCTSSLNTDVLIPLRLIIDTFGEDGFIDVNAKLKAKMFAVLERTLNLSLTVAEVDDKVIVPFKHMLPHFEACKETESLFLAILQKFITDGALRDSGNDLTGFVHLLFPIMELNQTEGRISKKPIIDIQQEPLLTTVLDLLSQKLQKLGSDVDLLTLLRKVRDFQPFLTLPFVQMLRLRHEAQVLKYISCANQVDLVYFINALRDLTPEMIEQIVLIIKDRKAKGAAASLSSFAKQFVVNHPELAKALVKIVKETDKAEFHQSLLDLSADKFVETISTFYNFHTEKEELLTLLEAYRDRHALRIYPFYSNLKVFSKPLYMTMIPIVVDKLKGLMCAELELQRTVSGQPILAFTQSLCDDPHIAKTFFNLHSASSVEPLIAELKATKVEDYFKTFLLFYNFWIQEELFNEAYPALLDDALERLASLLAENHALGMDLPYEKLDSLCAFLNVLSLSYKSVSSSGVYPIKDRFNPLYLQGLTALLGPKNVIKKEFSQATLVYRLLQNLSEGQLEDLICEENFEQLRDFFGSFLLIHTLKTSDHLKKGRMSTEEFEEGLFKITNFFEFSKHHILEIIQSRFLPKLLAKNIDLFPAYLTTLHLFDVSTIAEGLQKIHYGHVFALGSAYLDKYMKEFEPKKEEAEALTCALVLFDPARSKLEKEYNAMRGLYELSESDTKDFVFHSLSCMIKKAKSVLGIE